MNKSYKGRCSDLSKKKKLSVVTVITVVVLLISFIIFDTFSVNKIDYAMGAVITQNIVGFNAEKAAEEIINKIDATENAISWRIDGSEIANLNKNKFCDVTDETKRMFSEILDFCKKSGGVVDPTIGSVTRLWKIGEEDFKVPNEKEIKSALSCVSYESVNIKGNTVTIGQNQLIDLGFVGKGIACDNAKKILCENKIKSAIISVGGNLCLHGNKDATVGIRNPLGDVSEYMAVLTLKDCFVATSGNYERFSETDGKKYHHILSSKTGYPVENNLLSVTIVCDSGLLSDALSTAVYCLGYEKGLILLKEYNAEAVFIFNDKSIKITDGLTDKFEIKNNEFKLWKEN